MTLVVNGYSIFLIVLVSFLVSCALVPLVMRVAKHIGAMDQPNERKIHKKPLPTLGGIAIFLAFLIGYMLFAEQNTLMLSALIASFLVVILGIIDDIKPIKAIYKFMAQIVIAGIVVFYGDLQLTNITALGLNINFGVFSPFITIIFIIAIINAINLIDGLDGLASSVSSIFFLTVAIIGVVLNKFGGFDIMLSVIMLGATLGFLVYNFPPAKIFMGDTGSTFLGLMIAIIALLGFKNVTITSLFVPLLILAIPILDTLAAIIRRKLKGERIDKADKEHLHHQLLKLKFSPTKSLLIICFINILFSIASIFYAIGKSKEVIVIYVILLFLLLFIVLKTDIIFSRDKKIKRIRKQ